MSNQDQTHINTFASLHWYDETIKFIFNFVAKTSELLLAAGVVISSANFLTDGAIMQDHSPLSIAWAWAQALAIDSSLGIVFVNGFQAARERDKIKAAIYFILTAMLATVAGLLTHFDALAHATGLPVTSQSISGIIPLWLLTGLRAVAVIGYLLVSRLKNVSFYSQEPATAPVPQPAQAPAPEIDYNQLANTLVAIMQQQRPTLPSTNIEEGPLLPLLQFPTRQLPEQVITPAQDQKTHTDHSPDDKLEADERIARAYAAIQAERAATSNQRRISARELASRASVRRTTCSAWLEAHGTTQEHEANTHEIDDEKYA